MHLTVLLFSPFYLQQWLIGSSFSWLVNISGKSLCIHYWFDHFGILDISDGFSSPHFLECFSLLLCVLAIISSSESHLWVNISILSWNYYFLLWSHWNSDPLTPLHFYTLSSTLRTLFLPFPGQISGLIVITWTRVLWAYVICATSCRLLLTFLPILGFYYLKLSWFSLSHAKIRIQRDAFTEGNRARL